MRKNTPVVSVAPYIYVLQDLPANNVTGKSRTANETISDGGNQLEQFLLRKMDGKLSIHI